MMVDFMAARCLLFTPGNRPERFAKAVAASPDGVILDLEDAVPPSEKDAARSNVAEFLAAAHAESRAPVFVRINGLGTRASLADLAALANGALRPDGVLLPKTENPRDLAILRGLVPDGMPEMAIIETVQGLAAVERIAAAVGAGGGLGFGAADLSAEIGCEPVWEPLLYGRSRLVAAAGAAGLASFDVPYLILRDEAGLAAEAARARALGFTAKLAIHPAQVQPVLAAFTPTADAVDAARRVVAAFEGAAGGAIQVDGRMIDLPLYRSARRTLRRAGS